MQGSNDHCPGDQQTLLIPCGGLNRNGPHRDAQSTGGDSVKSCGFVEADMTLLEKCVNVEVGSDVFYAQASPRVTQSFLLLPADQNVELSASFVAPGLPVHGRVPHHDDNGLTSRTQASPTEMLAFIRVALVNGIFSQ